MGILDWFYLLPREEQRAMVGFTGAVLAFTVGLLQYRTSQRWRRAEWVAAETQRFLSDPVVRQALLMIDWWERRVVLFPDHPDPRMRVVRIDDDMVARALLKHSVGCPFNPVEAAIRDVFDAFLDGLSRMQQFVAAKLIDRRELKPYLFYWIRRIGAVHGQNGPDARLRQLHQYIQDYEFVDVTALLESFGYELHTQPEAEIDRLRNLDTSDWFLRIEDPILGHIHARPTPHFSSRGEE